MAPKKRGASPAPDVAVGGDANGSTSESGDEDVSGPVSIKETLWVGMEEIERVMRGDEPATWIPTGLVDLDHVTGLFRPGEVIVVAGRPSMGKTAFALHVASYAARTANIPVLLFPLETTKEATVGRMLVAEARIDGSRYRRGHFREDDLAKLARAASALAKAPVWIDDSPTRQFSELVDRIRQARTEHAVQLVVIDYIQLLEGPTPRAENRNQELAAISRALKGLAKELEISILVLAQCSRAPDQRSGDHRPCLTDVRDSGAVEEDADLVLFLYRQELYDGPADRDGRPIQGLAEIIIAKQRLGPAGIVMLRFDASCARFDSLARTAS